MLLFILIDGIIVCLSYWKSGVISFFQDIEQKSGSYIVFSGFILKKVELCDFSGSYSKKMEIYIVILGTKNGVIDFFVFIQNSECTFVISVMITW